MFAYMSLDEETAVSRKAVAMVGERPEPPRLLCHNCEQPVYRETGPHQTVFHQGTGSMVCEGMPLQAMLTEEGERALARYWSTHDDWQHRVANVISRINGRLYAAERRAWDEWVEQHPLSEYEDGGTAGGHNRPGLLRVKAFRQTGVRAQAREQALADVTAEQVA